MLNLFRPVCTACTKNKSQFSTNSSFYYLLQRERDFANFLEEWKLRGQNVHCMLSVSKLLGGSNFVILQKCCVAPFDQHFFLLTFFCALQWSKTSNAGQTSIQYRTCSIITRSWFETALDYKPRILVLHFFV